MKETGILDGDAEWQQGFSNAISLQQPLWRKIKEIKEISFDFFFPLTVLEQNDYRQKVYILS